MTRGEKSHHYTRTPTNSRSEVVRRLARLQITVMDGAPAAEIVRQLRLMAKWLERGSKPPVPPAPAREDLIPPAIFDHWAQAMGKKRAKLTPERRKKITARLKDGYTEGDIRLAIDNCARSEFHLGKNDAGREYNDLTLICRNGSKLEEFRDMGSEQPSDRYTDIDTEARERLEAIEREADRALSEGKTDAYNAANKRLRDLRIALGVHS